MNKVKIAAAKELISLYRGVVLDAVEQSLGDAPEWGFVRTRILRAFGDRGLEGRLIELLQDESSSGPTGY